MDEIVGMTCSTAQSRTWQNITVLTHMGEEMMKSR
jgi:hypothetical protein